MAAHLNIGSETKYYSDDDANEEGKSFLQQIVSESKGDREINCEKESNVEPDDTEANRDSRYIAKWGLEWQSQPFRKSNRSRRNIVNACPGITQYRKKCDSTLLYTIQ